jgi:hypothetical protein
MIVRINTRAGAHDVIPLDNAKWFMHPNGDDIAVCPIGLNYLYHKYCFIIYNTFAMPNILKMFDVGPGDEVFILGGSSGGTASNATRPR